VLFRSVVALEQLRSGAVGEDDVTAAVDQDETGRQEIERRGKRRLA
jgi:hypothetical protein